MISDNAGCIRIPFLIGLAAAVLTVSVGCDDSNNMSGSSGMLEADEVIMSAEVTGRVQLLHYAEGDAVRAGDTLLIIDPSRLELKLESAQAGRQATEAGLHTARLQLDQAEESERYAGTERDRIATLVNSGTATQRQLDQIEHTLTAATLQRQTAASNIAAVEAELARIDADIKNLFRQRQDCYPVSPADGIVTEKYIEAGELLAAGSPIVKISRLDTLWVKAYLPAGDFADIAIGDQAVIDIESGDRRYPGEVVWTSAEAEFTPKNVQTKKSRTNLVYAVKVRVANTDGRLKIGMPVFVTFEE
ncbi:MAG: HlyD family efflux transporter periplasmic adaptor subunit [bacterium]